MARNIIVLEDDSFVEEEIADDYEELQRIPRLALAARLGRARRCG